FSGSAGASDCGWLAALLPASSRGAQAPSTSDAAVAASARAAVIRALATSFLHVLPGVVSWGRRHTARPTRWDSDPVGEPSSRHAACPVTERACIHIVTVCEGR